MGTLKSLFYKYFLQLSHQENFLFFAFYMLEDYFFKKTTLLGLLFQIIQFKE